MSGRHWLAAYASTDNHLSAVTGWNEQNHSNEQEKATQGSAHHPSGYLQQDAYPDAQVRLLLIFS